MQDATRPAPLLVPSVSIPEINSPEPQPKHALSSGAAEVRVNVTRFVFKGNEALSEDTLRAVVAESENKALNFGELMAVVDNVEALYKAAGYFLAQAYLPPQKIKDGAIEISISEGRLGQTRLEGESRVKPNVVYTMLDQLPQGHAVKFSELERQVLLINDLAGSSATLDIQASNEPGYTDIVIAQKLDPLLSGRTEFNNHGMPATGKENVGMFLNAGSPFGDGERLSANVMRSSSGNLDSYGLNLDFPVGARGWHVTASTSLSHYWIATGEAAALNALGVIRSHRVGVTYPFIRSRNTNLNFKLDVAHNLIYSNNSVSGGEENKTRVVSATISGDWIDERFGGGANHAELALSGGNLELGALALASDNQTNGGYLKTLLTLQREQNIRPNLTLQGQLIHQQAGKNLDGSEKFSIGGPTTMPGYANGEASGDDGTLAKLKLNWRVRSDTAIGLFADYATIKAAHHPIASSDCNPAPSNTQNSCHFSNAGLSLDWQGKQGITLSMLVAWAYSESPNPLDHDRPRLWANVGYIW